MFLSFLLFVIIGFIPFVSAFFGLDINLQMSRKILPQAVIYFLAASIAKLFSVSVILPEVQGHIMETLLVTLVIHSFEFVFFREVFATCRIQNSEKANVAAFWWACFSAFSTNILSFISNSRTEELEIHHVVSAMSTLASLFVYFAMRNISLSISSTIKVWKLPGKTQLFILLMGLPAALSSMEGAHFLPLYAPDLMKLLAGAVIWAASSRLPPYDKTK